MPLAARDPVGAAFLSHAIEDAELAKTIKAALERQGVSVFSFESDLAFGQPIWNTVRRKVETSDYLLVLLSRSALASDAVAREVGLALELRETRTTPIIIGIMARDLSSVHVQPRRFDDGSPMATHIDFGTLRCFSDWQNDRALVEFGRSLHPRVRFVNTTDDPSSRDLFLRCKPCLYQLFPELVPTDYFERIWDWFKECEAPGSRWQDVLGVMDLDDEPVGLLYASVPRQGSFAFGNYFGILEGSRHLERARRLVENCRPRICEINSEIAGVVFEVEVPELSFLEEIAARSKSQSLFEIADQARLKLGLRALARLLIYQRHGARTLTSNDGQLLPIPTPSQRESFLNDPVGSHLLMFYPWESSNHTFSEVDLDSLMHFVYDDLYGDAYGNALEMGFSGYREYVAGLRLNFVEENRGRVTIGRAGLSRGVRLLPVKADLQGIMIDI